MKKKIAYYIFIAAFFIVCLVPSAGMLLKGESQPAANEILAQRPELILEDGTFNSEITADLTSYFADRFAFRQEMIPGYAAIQAALFQESSAEDVILGEDGWLFYKDTSDDFLHRSTLSDRSIQGIVRTLTLMQDYASEQGTSFLFTVAPNKNSLTPASEKMPDIGKVRKEEKNLQKLERAMKAQNICYADLTQVLSSGTDGESYYHRLDSHWNNMGAAVAAEELAEHLGVDIWPWTEGPYRRVKNHKGDLYEMLYPAGKKTDENIEFDRKFSFRYLINDQTVPAPPSTEDIFDSEGKSSAGRAAGPADDSLTKDAVQDGAFDYYSDSRPEPDRIKIETINSGSDEGNLLMFRDSFGNALYPFLADTFSYCAFSRLVPYRMDWLSEGDFDYVVVEIVERNLKNLAVKAPVMPAPPISYNDDMKSENGVSESAVRIAGTGETDVQADVSISAELPGYALISGTYDAENIDENTRIFIETEGMLYEACPVGSALEERQTDACFTAYLPEDILKGRDFSVILCRDGKFYRNSCETIWE